MFSRRKADEKPSSSARKPRGNLPLLGLDADMEVDDDDEGDEDLEKELAALVGGGARKKPKPKKKEVAPEVLNAMVADCMKDINDDDLSDTEDPDLLAELEDIQDDDEDSSSNTQSGASEVNVGVSHSFLDTIRERLVLYREAEAAAKTSGDSSRARRYNRGVNTLVELERRVARGGAVREEDIPPPVTVPGKVRPQNTEAEVTQTPASSQDVNTQQPPPPREQPQPPPREQPQPPSREQPPPPAREQPQPPPPLPARAGSMAQTQVGQINSQLAEIQAAKEEYKRLALAAKSSGDREAALTLVKYIKTCDTLAAEVRQGHSVDLAIIRQTPSEPSQAASQASEQQPAAPSQGEEEAEAPQAPITILESLRERLAKYDEEEKKALEAGNSGKARRMGRIKKQYEEAVSLHLKGRPIPRTDLPDPPGFAPIPLSDPQPPASRQAPSPRPGPAASTAASPPRQVQVVPSPPKKGPSPARQSSVMSVQEKQLQQLEKRQAMFKAAALQAKQQGQTDTAKEYLRQALSFNKLIEVSKAGLPVDMGTLPLPPQMQEVFDRHSMSDLNPRDTRNSQSSTRDDQVNNNTESDEHIPSKSPFSPCFQFIFPCVKKTNKVKTDMDFEIVSREDCAVVGDREEMYSKLEQDLISQVKMCMTNRKYFQEVGDIASGNKFEQMALHAKKDLDAVRFAFKRGDAVPKFHYETRAFSRVVSNTDLTDQDLELSIMSGINYVVKNPKDVDTYIKWEFPFPRDAPTIDKTIVVKDSNNPEYNSKHTIVINPRDKSFQRIVKRGTVKMEVWSKGGFLRSDTHIGTASMKLAPLETACMIHDSFDLYDGRKAIGGKVEAKIRIRNGILAKQIEQVQEKWLVVKF